MELEWDVRHLEHEVRSLLVGAAKAYGHGAAADIDTWAARLSSHVAQAIADGRQDLMMEIEEHAKLLAEKHRIRARNGAKQVFLAAVSGLTRGAIAIGSAALKGAIGDVG